MTLTTMTEDKPRQKPGPKKGSKRAGKDENKAIRAATGQESSVHSMSEAEKIRLATGKQTRLDLSFYERLPEYQGMQLFWENDLDGAVGRWLQLGAELVPRKNKSMKHFEGFTNKAESQWECVNVGGDGNGGQLLCYALAWDKEEYHRYRIAPKEARNKEIHEAMGIGKANIPSPVMSNVKGLKTYAPELPTGGRGLETSKDQTHDV